MREVLDETELARRMRGPDGTGKVMVLDVDRSSTKYHVYLRERASRHAYYLRPPEGMDAYDLKRILDEAGGESALEFRYYVYPELHTDLKPILTADPYAQKHFERNDERRFLQIEGERPKARQEIANLLEGLKRPFDPEEFPRINEFVLKSYRPKAEGSQAEAVLLRRDGDRNELRKSEPGFHVAIAEYGFGRELDVHRPVVSDTDPILILSSNSHTGESGYQFLDALASYFGSSAYAAAAVAADESAKPGKQADPRPPSAYVHHPTLVPRVEPQKVDGNQLLTRAAVAMKEQFPGMKLLRKREVGGSGPHIVVRFPGLLGIGKGPSDKEMGELLAIYRSTKGDPTFGSDWFAHYQVDDRSGELRIVTTFDARPPIGWTTLRTR